MPPTFRLLSRTADDDGAERQVVGAQPVRIDVDLVLLDIAADRGDLGDAGDGVELVADEPVLERAQLAQRLRRALDRVPEDVPDAGGVRAERRRHARGQALGDEAHALEDARPREVQIDVVLEDDVDHREAERRLRPHDPHAGQTLQVDRERIRDLVLDLLRAVAGPVGEDDHLVVGQVGNRVDRRGVSAHQPQPARPRYTASTRKRFFSETSISRLIMSHNTRHTAPASRATPPARTQSPGRHTTTVSGLDEENREEKVFRNGRDGYRRRRAPCVAQYESRDVSGQDNARRRAPRQ